VRFATHGDVPQLTLLFASTFPNHQVARLPVPLQEAFIRAHIARKLATVAIDADGNVSGFAIAGSRVALDRVRREFIVRNAFQLARHALSPHGGFLRRRAGRSEAALPPSPAPGELRFLAVAPHERGLGIGAALLRSVEDDLAISRPYCIWTLDSREPAMRFYRKHGFVVDYAIDGHVRMIKARQA